MNTKLMSDELLEKSKIFNFVLFSFILKSEIYNKIWIMNLL